MFYTNTFEVLRRHWALVIITPYNSLMQIWKSLHVFVFIYKLSWKFRILNPKNSRVIRP